MTTYTDGDIITIAGNKIELTTITTMSGATRWEAAYRDIVSTMYPTLTDEPADTATDAIEQAKANIAELNGCIVCGARVTEWTTDLDPMCARHAHTDTPATLDEWFATSPTVAAYRAAAARCAAAFADVASAYAHGDIITIVGHRIRLYHAPRFNRRNPIRWRAEYADLRYADGMLVESAETPTDAIRQVEDILNGRGRVCVRCGRPATMVASTGRACDDCYDALAD